MNNLNIFNLRIIGIFTISIITAVIISSCGSSSNSGFNSSANIELPITILNIQAQYTNDDSLWRAKRDMIKQLSIVDMNGDENRIFTKGDPGDYYTKQVKFNTKGGTWNVELIDYKGLMRDTIVSVIDYGEYTYRIPIILDNISPFEISEYMNALGEGRVIIDKLTN